MLTDPQVVTIDGVANSMPRISTGNLASKYSTSDGATSLRVSHTVNDRERSLVRLDLSKVGVDPLIANVSKTYTAAVYLVIDRPLNGAGFTDTEVQKAAAGFLAYCAVSGFVTKVLGLES